MNRTRLDLMLFKFALHLSFAAFLIIGFLMGGKIFGGYSGFSGGGAFGGLLLGMIFGILSAGFGLTLLSINDHLQVIRGKLAGEALQAPTRATEVRYFWLDASSISKGPATLNELLAMVERGEISADTRTAKPGDKTWVPLHTVLDAQERRG